MVCESLDGLLQIEVGNGNLSVFLISSVFIDPDNFTTGHINPWFPRLNDIIGTGGSGTRDTIKSSTLVFKEP